MAPLPSNHGVKGFTCGEREIDHWVASKAAKWSRQYRTKVFVAHIDGHSAVLGFYSLSFAKEDGGKLPDQRDREIYRSNGVPLVYLHFLGVQRTHQRCGLGKLLLIDCLRRAHHVSQHVAFYGVGLRSISDQTTTIYRKYGFGVVEPNEKHPLMILPIWTLHELFVDN